MQSVKQTSKQGVCIDATACRHCGACRLGILIGITGMSPAMAALMRLNYGKTKALLEVWPVIMGNIIPPCIARLKNEDLPIVSECGVKQLDPKTSGCEFL